MYVKILNFDSSSIEENVWNDWFEDDDSPWTYSKSEAMSKFGILEELNLRNLVLADWEYVNTQRIDFGFKGDRNDVKKFLTEVVGVEDKIEHVMKYGIFICD